MTRKVWIIYRADTILKVFAHEHIARVEQAMMLARGIYSTVLVEKSIG